MAEAKRSHKGEEPIRPIEDKKISKRRFMVFLKDISAFSVNYYLHLGGVGFWGS
jgi:hypothetical protein